jgi:hypothetical protein
MTGRVRVNHLFDELVGADPRSCRGRTRGCAPTGGDPAGETNRTRDEGAHGGAPLRGASHGTGTR